MAAGIASVIATLIYVRQTLGPLLDGLPVADNRISLNDRLEQQSKALSSKILLLFGLASILIVLIAAFHLPILAIPFAGIAAWYFWLVFLRWKAARVTHGQDGH